MSVIMHQSTWSGISCLLKTLMPKGPPGYALSSMSCKSCHGASILLLKTRASNPNEVWHPRGPQQSGRVAHRWWNLDVSEFSALGKLRGLGIRLGCWALSPIDGTERTRIPSIIIYDKILFFASCMAEYARQGDMYHSIVNYVIHSTPVFGVSGSSFAKYFSIY